MVCYQRATGLDQYLAIAYFQEGVSNFLLGDFEEALANFNDTLLYLRGNMSIDYEQLGLKFRLFSCEVLFNRGLCYIYLRQMGPGMQDLECAAREKVTPDHSVINDAIRDCADVRLTLCGDLSNLRRATRYSPSPSGSSTGRTPQKSRISRPRTIWERRSWFWRRTETARPQAPVGIDRPRVYRMNHRTAARNT